MPNAVELIQQSYLEVTGTRISAEPDTPLTLSSLDLVDFFSELEKRSGRKLNLRELLLFRQNEQMSARRELTVGEIAAHLAALNKSY